MQTKLTLQFLAFFAFATAVAWMVFATMGDLFLRNPAKWWWVTLPAFPLIIGVWWVLWQRLKTAPGNKNQAVLLAVLVALLVTQTARWWLR